MKISEKQIIEIMRGYGVRTVYRARINGLAKYAVFHKGAAVTEPGTHGDAKDECDALVARAIIAAISAE